MTHTEVFKAVTGILREHLQVSEPLSLETELQRDLALDSLRQLTFVVELENRFRICFDAEDEHELNTLGDVVRLVQARLAPQGVPA
jgi:acyl carrier protein